MAESTTLLVEHHESDTAHEIEPPRTHAFVNLLKGINLCVSALALALLVTTHIIIKNVPTGSSGWEALYTTKSLAIWMLVSLILAAINVAVSIPNLINIVVDIVLASNITTSVFDLIYSLPKDYWCKMYRYPPYPNPPEEVPLDPKCQDWKVIIQCLMIAGSVFGVVVAMIYFTLFVLRTIAIIKSKFWKRFTLGPQGEISFTISFRLFRSEDSAGRHRDGDEAGPSSGRGPVYI